MDRIGETTWARHDQPTPPAYRTAALVGGVVVLVCYATTRWSPGLVSDWATSVVPRPSLLGPLLFLIAGTALGLMVASAAWVALTRPWLGIGMALLPLLGIVPGLDAPLHFGVIAGLCAVAVSAGWRRPLASVLAIALAEVIVVGWLFRPDLVMSTPFGGVDPARLLVGGTSDHDRAGLLGRVRCGAGRGLRTARVTRAERSGELLASRAGQVEQQAGVVAERARLARDLHDVVAHHVSLIAVRAETAPYTHPEPGCRRPGPALRHSCRRPARPRRAARRARDPREGRRGRPPRTAA